MPIRIVRALAVALGMSSGGCATIIPPFDLPYRQTSEDPNDPRQPTVDTIIRRIQCELAEIANERGGDIAKDMAASLDIQVVVELSIAVTQDGKIAPTFSLIDKGFSIGTGFSYERSREQIFTTYLTFALSNYINFPTGDVCKNPADTNLSGKLGIVEMFRLANTAGPFQDYSKSGNFGSFGGSVAFTVDSQLSATGVTYKLIALEGAGPALSAGNKNVDRLTFGFVKGPKSGTREARERAYGLIETVKTNQINNSLSIIANTR